jgi:hypothetical protein
MPQKPQTILRLSWWLSAPLALLMSAVFGYFFVGSLQGDDPPWDPPWAAATYRVAYGVLALLFLGGAAVALRGKPRTDQ